MNCNVFTKNLDKFIADDIPEYLKLDMKKHMMACQNCRMLYEEELLLERALYDTLSVDDIIFESQKQNIMNKIDVNKYRKNNTINFKMYKNLLKIGVPIAAAITIAFFMNPLSSFQNGNGTIQQIAKDNTKIHQNQIDNNVPRDQSKLEIQQKDETKTIEKIAKVSNNNDKIESNSNEKIFDKHDANKDSYINAGGHIGNNSDKTSVTKPDDGNSHNPVNNGEAINDNEKPNEDVDDKNTSDNIEEPIVDDDKELPEETPSLAVSGVQPAFVAEGLSLRVPVSFTKKPLDLSVQYKLLDYWNESPDKSFAYYLLRNEDMLYVRDVLNKENWCLELKIDHRESTPKYIGWDDNDTLFIVFQESEGEINFGEELYTVDVKTGNALMIYRTFDSKRSIVDIKREGENIKLKINTNKYNNYSNSYDEYTVYNVPTDI